MQVRLRCLPQRLLLWTAAIIATPAASAADFASPVADAVAALPVAAEWTGFYAGLGLGGRWTDTEWTTDCLAPVALPAGCPNDFFPGSTRIGNDNPVDFGEGAFRIGGHTGFDWQISTWVLGVEGDLGWGDTSQTRTGIPGTWPADLGGGFDSASVESQWDASLRARIGFLLTPSLLLYSTGGVAVLWQEVGATCEAVFPVGWCVVPNSDFDTETYIGWTLGAGGEWMFAQHWSLRGEYRYSDYGSRSFTFFADEPIDSFSFSVEQKAQTAYIGVTYRF
jgi:outer membrane immunogenic protein